MPIQTNHRLCVYEIPQEFVLQVRFSDALPCETVLSNPSLPTKHSCKAHDSEIPRYMKQGLNKLISKCLCDLIRLSKDIMWMPNAGYRRGDFFLWVRIHCLVLVGRRRWTGLQNEGMLSNGSRSKAPSLQESSAVRAWICKRFQTRLASFFLFFFLPLSPWKVSQATHFSTRIAEGEKNVIFRKRSDEK